MKLKCKELQELYDKVICGTFTFTPSEEDPVDKLFRECDEKLDDHISYNYLRELQDRMDIIEKSNGVLLSANMESISEKRKLKKDLDDLLCRAHHAEDAVEDLKKRLMETTETLEKANADRTELQKDRDFYHGLYTELSKVCRKHYKERSDEISELKADNEEMKETLEKVNADRTELQKDRDFYHGLYTKLDEENRKLKIRTDCHRNELTWYRNHYKEQSDKISELKSRLKSRLNSMYGVESIQKLPDNVRKNCYDQGQTDLWVKLQNIRDVGPEEFDPECGCFGDILDMDLEDFLDTYKNWEEEKHLNYMRDYLARFCEGRVCKGCPLESTKYKCGCGYSFKKSADWDMSIIPDEELEKYYDKAKNYLRTFRNDRSCTIEATVKINKDLLNAICGIKPGEDDNG